MFKKVFQMLTVSIASSLMTIGVMSSIYVPKADYDMLQMQYEERISSVQYEEVAPVEAEVIESFDISGDIIAVSKTVEEYSLSQEEIELIALVTMAEAEGESEYGQRLVIDSILNRVDHPAKYIPDTVTEVIYQPHQFTSMWNGRVDRCYVKPELVELVKEELVSRTDYDVIFFRTSHYSEYGTPMFQEGAHFFSKL